MSLDLNIKVKNNEIIGMNLFARIYYLIEYLDKIRKNKIFEINVHCIR